MLFYLDSAVKQKDTEVRKQYGRSVCAQVHDRATFSRVFLRYQALEITLQKADALGMQNVEGVKHAREVLKRLQVWFCLSTHRGCAVV